MDAQILSGIFAQPDGCQRWPAQSLMEIKVLALD
jgi:hypothetical protein